MLEAIEIAFIDQHGVESVDRSWSSAAMDAPSARSPSVLSAKGIVDPGDWPKCVTIGRIDSMRVVGDKESDLERRYHQLARPHRRAIGCRGARRIGASRTGFTGSPTSASATTPARSPSDNAPQNLSMLRKIPLQHHPR